MLEGDDVAVAHVEGIQVVLDHMSLQLLVREADQMKDRGQRGGRGGRRVGNRSRREEGDPEGRQPFGMAVEETVSHSGRTKLNLYKAPCLNIRIVIWIFTICKYIDDRLPTTIYIFTNGEDSNYYSDVTNRVIDGFGYAFFSQRVRLAIQLLEGAYYESFPMSWSN